MSVSNSTPGQSSQGDPRISELLRQGQLSSSLAAWSYDRAVDILWIRFQGYDGLRARASEREWGLEEHDSETGDLAALEIWRASKLLPERFLHALPSRDNPE